MPTAREAIDANAAACNTSDPETARRLVEQATTEDALMAGGVTATGAGVWL